MEPQVMADTKVVVESPNRSESRSVLAFFKWIFKTVLTHAGCLAQDDSDDDDDLGLYGSSRERLTNDDRVHSDTCASGSSCRYSDPLGDAGLSWSTDDCLNNRRNNDNSTNNSDKDITNNNIHSNINKSANNSRNNGLDPFDDTYREKSSTMSFQNCTMPSFDRDNGGSYWASFTEKSFNKGNRFKVYSGIFNGDGRKRGDKLVVKVFKERAGTASMCDCEVRKSNKARDMARDFNQLNGHRARIRTANIYSASMDEVSVLKNIFFRGSRKLTTKEEVLFEDDLRVDDEKPNKMRKLTSYIDHHGKQNYCRSHDLEAFVHFTYHQTGGQLVVAGLEGVAEANGFVIKTPIIHSRQKEYGGSDKGVDGIRLVFENHVCNELCQDMIKPRSAEEEEEEEEVDNCIETVSQKRGSQIPERSENILKQSSASSHQTENMSGYIEPTAPIADECDESLFHVDARNYSIVANWILGEHARNSLIENRRPNPAECEWRREEEAEKHGVRGEEIVCEGRPDIESQMSVDSRTCDLTFRKEGSVSSTCFSPDEANRTINWPHCNERPLMYSASTTRSTSGIGTFAGSVVDNPESPAGCPNTQLSFIMQRQTSATVMPTAQACASSFQVPHIPETGVLPQQGSTCPWQGPGGERPDLRPSSTHGWVESPPSYHESQNAYMHQWLREHCYRGRGAPFPFTDYDNNGNTIVQNMGHRM